MSPAEQARADQLAAREREFERRALPVLWAILAVFALLGLYSVLALQGYLPLAPWSPAAQ